MRAVGGSRPVHSASPDDEEAEMDERTTLTDDELTRGAFSTRAEVADADEDDADSDADDSDAGDSDSDDSDDSDADDADDADDSDS